MSADYRVIEPGSDEWPAWLNDLGDRAPERLWLRGPGNLRVMTEQAVAIVGSRACTAYGSDVAYRMADGLVRHGHTIVSGLAYGIDVAAHRGAMDADPRATIAVLACGVDRCYPSAHQTLYESIAETGLIVSEYEPGSAPFRDRFMARNRLIVALSRATIVVEAARRSGSMNSAQWATHLGRPLYAVPGPVTSVQSEGPHSLIAEGHAFLTTSAEHLVKRWAL